MIDTTGQSGSNGSETKSSSAKGDQNAGAGSSEPAPQQKVQTALVRVTEREIRPVAFRKKGIDATYLVLGAIVLGLLLLSLLATYQRDVGTSSDAGTASPSPPTEDAQLAESSRRADSPALHDEELREGRLAIPPEVIADEVNSAKVTPTDHGDTSPVEYSKTTEAVPHSGQLVTESQRILKMLGYAPGPVDGLIGPRTMAAVSKFQSDNKLEVDGLLDAELYRQLIESKPVENQVPDSGNAHGSTATPGRGDITHADLRAIQYTCAIRVQEFYSSAAFEQCVRKLVAELQGYPLDPAFASLAPADRRAIDANCERTKREHGPGAYNQCIREHIVDLHD